MATREGKATTPHPVALLARNLAPKIECAECDKEATVFCFECLAEEGDPSAAVLCEAHAESHRHGEEGEFTPVANSPRMGMCGYAGPAEPPY